MNTTNDITEFFNEYSWGMSTPITPVELTVLQTYVDALLPHAALLPTVTDAYTPEDTARYGPVLAWLASTGPYPAMTAPAAWWSHLQPDEMHDATWHHFTNTAARLHALWWALFHDLA